MIKFARLLFGIGLVAFGAYMIFWGFNIEDPSSSINQSQQQVTVLETTPPFLSQSFPEIDFTQGSIDQRQILNGGPPKDGIPALTNPDFESLSDTSINKQVLAVVYEPKNGEARVYPYNIMNYHEIVNDQVDGESIAVTFCPLCGSALVFDRSSVEGAPQFGVSGSLLESNMIMYDRSDDGVSLWQQSTGEAIVGSKVGQKLDILSFQLMTIQEAQAAFPDGLIMTEETGHIRDYDRNPYNGYDQSDDFPFSPSSLDQSYPVKEIFLIIPADNLSVALRNSQIESGDSVVNLDNGQELKVTKQDSIITIDLDGQRQPYYYEMWFSWAVQHKDKPSQIIAEI